MVHVTRRSEHIPREETQCRKAPPPRETRGAHTRLPISDVGSHHSDVQPLKILEFNPRPHSPHPCGFPANNPRTLRHTLKGDQRPPPTIVSPEHPPTSPQARLSQRRTPRAPHAPLLTPSSHGPPHRTKPFLPELKISQLFAALLDPSSTHPRPLRHPRISANFSDLFSTLTISLPVGRTRVRPTRRTRASLPTTSATRSRRSA